ncbi:hypothetical protein ACTFIV_002174 [Dictyostelium citrinum]
MFNFERIDHGSGNERSKLGFFITSSRDYHVLTGIVRMPREKAGIVDTLLKTAFAEEIPYAVYHTTYSTDHIIVFGLIECKAGDQMKSGQHISEIANFTIRTASKIYSSQKELKQLTIALSNSKKKSLELDGNSRDNSGFRRYGTSKFKIESTAILIAILMEAI